MGRRLRNLVFIGNLVAFGFGGYFGRPYIDSYLDDTQRKPQESGKIIGEIHLKADQIPYSSSGSFTATDRRGRTYDVNYNALKRTVSIKESVTTETADQ